MKEPSFGNMTDEQLAGALEEFRASSDKYQSALAEQNRRLVEAHQKEETENRAKLLDSAKVKTLAAKYKKAMDRINACEGKYKLVVTLPITFTMNTDVYSFDCNGYEEVETDDVFGCKVEAKIDQAEGINRVQKALLQRGLDMVVQQACGEIEGLFPARVAEQCKAVDEINVVRDALSELDLTVEDLE